ncbi:MAG: isocitrate/isopropylmalate family dehydrogenase, partial [bacterium]|nr:isocitrate/isopropylmalate family dehydrogenase [bacterium]
MKYQKLEMPKYGEKVEVKEGKIIVPDNPVIPFIEGDGIGPDIWRVTQKVIDSAVEKSYRGKKSIVWVQIYAGLSALKKYGKDEVLPEDTLQAIRDYKVAIKGPLTTPVGGFDYVCLVCAKEQNGIEGKRPEKCIQCGSEYIVPRFRSLNVELRQKLDL